MVCSFGHARTARCDDVDSASRAGARYDAWLLPCRGVDESFVKAPGRHMLRSRAAGSGCGAASRLCKRCASARVRPKVARVVRKAGPDCARRAHRVAAPAGLPDGSALCQACAPRSTRTPALVAVPLALLAQSPARSLSVQSATAAPNVSAVGAAESSGSTAVAPMTRTVHDVRQQAPGGVSTMTSTPMDHARGTCSARHGRLSRISHLFLCTVEVEAAQCVGPAGPEE
jgi:hypothetical protein